MNPPAHLLLVRLESDLPSEEIERVMKERAPEFAALRRLRQKYYLHDPETGAYRGCYLWDSPEDLDAYRQSELRATIAKAYRARQEPRVEVYRILTPLRD